MTIVMAEMMIATDKQMNPSLPRPPHVVVVSVWQMVFCAV